jgi:hypothetical protein
MTDLPTAEALAALSDDDFDAFEELVYQEFKRRLSAEHWATTVREEAALKAAGWLGTTRRVRQIRNATGVGLLAAHHQAYAERNKLLAPIKRNVPPPGAEGYGAKKP